MSFNVEGNQRHHDHYYLFISCLMEVNSIDFPHEKGYRNDDEASGNDFGIKEILKVVKIEIQFYINNSI